MSISLTLANLIIARVPLYSFKPYEVLVEKSRAGLFSPQLIEKIIVVAMNTVTRLERKASSSQAKRFFDIVHTFFISVADDIEEEQRQELDLSLLEREVHILRSSFDNEEYRELVARLMQRTANPQSLAEAKQRLNALVHFYAALQKSTNDREKVQIEVGELLNQFSALKGSIEHLAFLRTVAWTAMSYDEQQILQEVNKEYRELWNDPLSGEFVRSHLMEGPLLYLLHLYDAPEEFVHREEEYRLLHRIVGWREVQSHFGKIRWLFDAGYVDELIEGVNQIVQVTLDRGNIYDYLNFASARLACQSIVTFDRDQTEKDFTALPYEKSPDPERSRTIGTSLLCTMLFLCDEADLARRFIEEHRLQEKMDLPYVILAGYDKDLFSKKLHSKDQFASLVKTILVVDTSSSQFDQKLHKFFKHPILRVQDALSLYALLHLLKRAFDMEELLARYKPDVAEALNNCLSFFGSSKRRIPRSMEYLLREYGKFLSRGDREKWKKIVGELQDARYQERKQPSYKFSEGKKLRITMIGSIRLQRDDGRDIQIKGARVAMIFGAIVADQMLERPLETVEFNQIVTGESDPIHARKILKVALFRLRELVGNDVIITRNKKIELNLEKVSVDLLEAEHHLTKGEEALQSEGHALALSSLSKVLELVQGQVIFPKLYDRFFEAMRGEFESRLSHAVHILAERLVEQGEHETAERLLRGVNRAVIQ